MAHTTDTEALQALQALVARGLVTIVGDDSDEPRYCLEPLVLADLLPPAPDQSRVTPPERIPRARPTLRRPGACSPRRQRSE